MEIRELANEIIKGRRLTREDDLRWMITCDLKQLCGAADSIREHFKGNHVDLCSIVNGKSGRCSEDCRYCAQSAWNHTGCEEYSFLGEDEIFALAKSNQEAGVNRFAIVTSGRALKGEDFEKALSAVRKMKADLNIGLCASMGYLTLEQFQRLKEAGVTNYHDNLETSRAYFPKICTTHTWEGKVMTLKSAMNAGMTVCSGGIIGMGESWEDRIDLALSLAELGIASIPLNVLMPIKGTPFEDKKVLSDDEICRTTAVFRFINPEAHIRMAGGRRAMKNAGMRAFMSGASAAITGDMLTTTASTVRADREMLGSIGLDTTPAWSLQ